MPKISTSYQVKYGDTNFIENVYQTLMQEGLVIVTDIFTLNESDHYMDQIVTSFEKLGSGLNRHKIQETWKTENLPPQTRAGMYQSIMSNSNYVWELRTHPRVKEIFQGLYSNICEEEITKFVTSIDGINVKPPGPPYHSDKPKDDWPHLDQTIRDDMTLCIQGQIILSNTSAGFRCSPRSHLVHNEILDLNKVEEDDSSNWCKFGNNKILLHEMQELVENKGGQWQIPIIVPKGSMIFWFSSLVHSAKYQDKNAMIDPQDIWSEWRGVIYVCYRPKNEISLAQLNRLKYCFMENRVTNHWGSTIFPKSRPFTVKEKYHPKIRDLIDNPKIYYKIEKPKLTKEIRSLIC